MALTHARVSDEVIDPELLRAAVACPGAGAVTSFIGQIRDHDPEAEGVVTGIDYSAHPDAEAMIGPIVQRVLDQLDPEGEAVVAAQHRIGHLEVGEVALVVCVATGHRQLCFGLVPAIVEAIKTELPIWKHQTEADGRTVWSNLGVAGDA